MKQPDNFIPEPTQPVLDQYRRYKAEMSEIQRKLTEIQDNKSDAASAQRQALFTRLDALRADIFKLVPFNQDAFEKYAERMLGHVRDTILNNGFMSDCIMNWGTMDAAALHRFGAQLVGALDKHYRESDTAIEFILHPKKADASENVAEYDWDNKIYLYADDYIQNPDDFIGTLLHEYIHYLCVKHPGKSPLGKRFALIAARHYLEFLGGPTNQKEFDEYKNQPFERPAYQIQDYVTARGFAKNLRADIIVRRANMHQHDTI